MPTPNKPDHTSWIQGSAHGKTYKLRFVDYGHGLLDLQLSIEGRGVDTYGKVPRENSIQYEKTGHNDYIDGMLHNILTFS